MDTIKLIAKFNKAADTLTKQIEHKRRPMTQNPTPKRLREYNSRLYEANDLERVQRGLYALAAAHTENNLPLSLAAIQSKQEISKLVHKGLNSIGYYDVSEAKEYTCKTPQALALQKLIDNDSAGDRLDGSERQQRQQREKSEDIRRRIDQLRFQNIPGFFPTPNSLVCKMIQEADMDASYRVLEPPQALDRLRINCENLPRTSIVVKYVRRLLTS